MYHGTYSLNDFSVLLKTYKSYVNPATRQKVKRKIVIGKNGWTKEQAKEYSKQYYYTEQRQTYLKKWNKENKDKIKLLVRKSQLKNSYNITVEDYDNMFINQNECCAICKQHQSKFKIRLAVDHCHKTGKIRGLLCGKCNTHLGYYENQKENIKNYLK